MADKLRLSSMLFTNQQRLEEICEILDKAQGSAAERLQAVAQHIRDIENYKFVGETGLRLETLIGTARLTVKTYLEINPTVDPDFLGLLRDFATTKNESDYYDALSKLREIQDHYRTRQKADKGITPAEVFLLLDCVWHYTFTHYYWVKETKDKTSDASGEVQAG